MRGSLDYREVKMLKRISLVLILALAMVFAFGGVAYANFGPHGGYVDDTDACAGCHRAHTSFSDLTWTDDTIAAAEHSALLISGATTMSEFCNACHGDAAPGASTNVVSGVFDSGPSGDLSQPAGTTHTDGTLVEFETNSSFDATLNGGGFDRVPEGTIGTQAYKTSTSAHDMDLGAGLTDPMWGDGNAVPASANLTCTGCHDVHGSSNYRLLKDVVNGNVVGGYIDDDTPTPWVVSAEEGYPSVGWRKHENGAVQMAAYRPNYTSAEYAQSNDPTQGMSGWCSACHEVYNVRNDATVPQDYNYGEYIASIDGSVQLGAEEFHRHPVNVSLVGGDPAGYGDPQTSWLRSAVVTTSVLPLEMAPGGDAATFRAGEWDYGDFMGCLTCHRAHGTSADMTGWAEAALDTTNGTDWYPVRSTQPTVSGVNPNFTSALLRTDNRGVCERCHNK
jgi:predicted CXXCH cytochrome family protein